ncbi:nitric oxide reductase transcriptional regulator NorR [Neptunomonas sp.]|uniref:nitric oxide reductase transcriptional regulator NorR n=1 Tax=Neptunomonas TaxID=75687 RepID=UPI003515596F
MKDVSPTALVDLSMDLARSLHNDDRFERLLDAVRKCITCDAIVLLVCDHDTLRPLAQQGLHSDVLGRRFLIDHHPRFHAMMEQGTSISFPADSSLPDPYDGLVLGHNGELPIHACLGIPLIRNQRILGVLTLDSLTAGAFDALSRYTLDVIGTCAGATLDTALTMAQLERQSLQQQQMVSELNQHTLQRTGSELIGQSAVMQSLKREISLVAISPYTVLIEGETGVGKERVAAQLHQESPRADTPLVYVNCAALPDNLIESELFGHKKGAFTGADQDRTGKFRLADGGTLFLDEIGEIPLTAQSKLLRALQEQEVQPVGQDVTETVDVRVIAATNRDLAKEVEAGRFRADLYHRLSVYPIHIPPLREREGDVALLAGFFAEQLRHRLGLEQIILSPDVSLTLAQYDWPGNVRELEHVISRAALRARAREASLKIKITPADLEHLTLRVSEAPTQTPQEPDGHLAIQGGLRQATEVFQRLYIYQTLQEADGNWSEAARRLEVDRANLTRLAKRLGIQVKRRVVKEAK